MSTQKLNNNYRKKTKTYNDNVVKSTLIQKSISNTLTLKENTNAGYEGLIEPPFGINLFEFKKSCAIFSNSLLTIAKNSFGFGYTLEKEDDTVKDNQKELDLAYEILDNVHTEKSISDIFKRNCEDGLLFGYAPIEIVFSPLYNKFNLENIPAEEFRMTYTDTFYTEYKKLYYGKFIKDVYKFRRYAQYQDGIVVFFKHYLDPRNIDAQSGNYLTEITSETQLATSCYMFDYGMYTGHYYPYPIWTGIANDISGNYNASKLNKEWFENGMMVNSALLVSGGRMTKTAIDEIRKLLESVKGDNTTNILVLEATGQQTKTNDYNQGVASSVPKMEFVELPSSKHTDAHFLNYLSETSKNIRSMFGLHAIFLGLEESYNRATAEVAYEVANQQIFQPNRVKTELIINNLLQMCGISTYRFKWKTPTIADYSKYPELMKQLIELGSIPINTVNDIFEEVTSREIPDLENGDMLVRDWKKQGSENDMLPNQENNNNNNMDTNTNTTSTGNYENNNIDNNKMEGGNANN